MTAPRKKTWRRGLQANTDTLPYRGTSAGGGYSTVEDLLKFASAVENHKLLDAKKYGVADHREGGHGARG